MTEPATPLDNSAYSVGWIAALPHERAAAEAMLDEKHVAPPQHKQPNDDNIYTLGSIKAQNSGEHNIVIASLPAGRYGITPAATAAAHMLSSFPGIKFGLMVGIGGGIPDLDYDRDIRLGDVVVAQPEGSFGGVRQYDLGQTTVDGFKETGVLSSPPRVLLNGLTALQSKHEMEESEIPIHLASMREKYPLMAKPRQGPGYVYQGSENDRLFQGRYRHDSGGRKKDCRGCDPEKAIPRQERDSHDPFIFYGTIASGNKRYAAATAAAYAKELLTATDVADVNKTPEARMIMSEILDLKCATDDIATYIKHIGQEQRRKKLYEWLTTLDSSARHSDHQKARAEDTGLWLLEHELFQRWSNGAIGSSRTLCCFGDPGAGKTVLTSLVIDHLSKRIVTEPTSALAYMYCDYRDNAHRKAESIFGMITKQLLEQLLEIPAEILQIHEGRKRQNQAMTLEDAKTICITAIQQFSGYVYICLDAIDELAQEPLHNLMEFLGGGPPLRIYLTGRTHIQDTIEGKIAEKDIIIIQAQGHDIRQFIMREIGGPSDVAPSAMDNKLKADIVSHIVDSAQGLFLLPVLQIRAVLHAVTKRDRADCLKILPQNLGEAFADTLTRINQQVNPLAELARKVITWVHFGLKTFTIQTLKSLLAIRDGDTRFDPRGEPDIETLIASCHGLIVVGIETSTIQLVHFSLQEYFASQEEIFGRSREQWHSALAATCLTFLFFPDTRVKRQEEAALDSDDIKSSSDSKSDHSTDEEDSGSNESEVLSRVLPSSGGDFSSSLRSAQLGPPFPEKQ
ncbi:hypothetical protein BJX68DRAFT_276955 [Aspergillus pseudodeflectus]|uniref:Nephrocystin 3-like N-terminal domain-containing protein n=1 Tax=Aspergillus pseudodeflectus TaxID=176178 RepID=A0ABR4K456_9EURO